MNRTEWRKVFAFTGVAFIGLVLAFYATSVATGGIVLGNAGRSGGGADVFTSGSAALLVGIAMFAVFGYLALKLTWSLMKEQR